MKFFRRLNTKLLAVLLAMMFVLSGCSDLVEQVSENLGFDVSTIVGNGTSDQTDKENGELSPDSQEDSSWTVSEDGTYSSKDEVALYLHLYGHLPDNYITKKEAEALGWQSNKGNLWDVAPEKSIGGDRFGNYEGLLPSAKGRQYQECDIDFDGGYRNSKRIIFSNDGLIYYTEDHYESFEHLYGEEE